MQSAIDKRSGQVVAASLASPWGQYVCRNPKCRGPVFLKPGRIRAAHFAHFEGAGTDDCDEYFPGYGAVTPSSTAETPISRERPAWERPGFYLRRTLSQYRLELALPVLPPQPTWTGSVLHREATGTKRFRQPHFTTRTTFAVTPSTDSQRFEREGVVADAVWSAVKDGIPSLGRGPNVFAWSDSAGRHREKHQPLFWGDKYWVLLPPTGRHDVTTVEDIAAGLGDVSGWPILELRLPEWDIASQWPRFKRELVSSWLGHPLKPRDAQVWITHPLPLHLDVDTWIFPEAEVLELSVQGGPVHEPVSILSSQGRWVALERLSEDRYLFRPDRTAHHSIYLGMDVALTFRTKLPEKSDLLLPPALNVIAGEQSTPLYQAKDTIAKLRQEGRGSELRLEPQALLARVPIRVNGVPISQPFIGLTEPHAAWALDAECYGRVRIDPLPVKRKVRQHSQRTIEMARWLASLPCPRSGEHAARMPEVADAPDWAKAICGRSWPIRFQPHVLHLADSLIRGL